MTTGKVLKERRSHRERGRMGSSLTSAPASSIQTLICFTFCRSVVVVFRMSLDMSVATAAIAAAVMRKFETAMASAS